MLAKLSNIWFIFRSFFPRKLPTGMILFERWLDDIARLSGLPDNAKLRQVAAGFILQLPPGLAYLSIRKISNALVKAASNQIAVEVIRSAKSNSDEDRVKTVS